MKYLVYNSCSLAHPHYGVQIDEVIKLNKEGHEVVFAYCDGVLDTCFMNPLGNKAICKLCNMYYHNSLNVIKDKNHILPLTKQNSSDYEFIYNSIEEFKKIEYKGVRVGDSVLSTYISKTRNSTPEFTNKSKKYFNHLVGSTCDLTDVIYSTINELQIEGISIYNGRFYENRPFFDIARKLKLKITCNEIVGGPISDEKFFKVSFYNVLPHDIKYNCDLVNNIWDNSIDTICEKEHIGNSFFLNRRKGVPTVDRVYIKHQVRGKLPSDWSTQRRNIVIFNSSEDEFVSLGEEFDNMSLFVSQLEGIKYILSSIKEKEYKFYLRVHPNLKYIPYSYHKDLYLLENQFDNITVIPADDDVSTYDLIAAAEKIIVFGSTTGIEASYWGKIVLLIGPSFYYYLNSCYKPSSKEDLISLIKNDKLISKPKLDAIKYAYFLMDRKIFVEKYLNVDIDYKKINILGCNLKVVSYLKMFGSPIFGKIFSIIWFRTVVKVFKNRLEIPDPLFKE